MNGILRERGREKGREREREREIYIYIHNIYSGGVMRI